MQAQHPSSSVTEASTIPLKIGDSVSYFIARTLAHSIRLSICVGVIEAIDGQVAIVVSGHGRSLQPLNKLSRDGELNALTIALIGRTL
jgi:hypothetical protein